MKTWREIAQHYGTTPVALRKRSSRYNLSKQQIIDWLERRTSKASTQADKAILNSKSYSYKDTARSVARKSDTDILHRHHWSYREEHYADTILMSVEDHHALHSYLVYDPVQKMYRDKNGALLSSKSSHFALLSYIRTVK